MDDPSLTRSKNSWKAKNECKKQLTNTLNAINWYGKGTLDEKGEIDIKKFTINEYKTQKGAVKGGVIVDISQVAPVKKFDTKVITAREAFDLQLS
jgi:hypothetical protein